MAAPVRKLHFNSLPGGTRKRLVESLSKQGEPRPVADFPEGFGGPVFGWSLLALLGLGGIALFVFGDFGSPYNFHEPFGFVLGYVVSFFFALWGLLAVVRAFQRRSGLPFPRGRYLFPLELVVAKDATLEILPTSAIENVQIVHHYHNGAYTGSRVELRFPGKRLENLWVRKQADAQALLDSLRDAQSRVRDAANRNDLATLQRLDVLSEVRGSPVLDDPSALASYREQHEREIGTPLAHDPPVFVRRAALVGFLAALVIAPPFFFARNLLSEEIAFATLSREGGSGALQHYLESGMLHTDEVRNVLLPRAVFQEAVASNTVSALRDFLRRFPHAPQVGEARTAIHARYVQSLDRFLAQAPADSRMIAFMQRLVAFLEAHDTVSVKVRFAAPSTDELTAIDTELSQRSLARSGKTVEPIAPQFTPERTATLETSVTQLLDRGFSQVFPADILDLEHQGRLPKGSPPDAASPTFDVDYVVRPNGAFYENATDPRAFVGIHVDFHVRMRVPGDTEGFEFRVAVEPPQTFTVHDDTPGQSSAQRIYATMTERAFDQLGDQLAGVFFRQSPKDEPAAPAPTK
ncbi:MAG: hypothetical protein U0230_21960 [Polyangiales bacterium]